MQLPLEINILPTPINRPRPKNDNSLNDKAPLPRSVIKSKKGDDIFENLNLQIDEVSNVLQDNIEKSICNMENIDNLSKSSDDLKQNSVQFNRNSKKIKKKMFWKNKKLTMVIGGIIVVVIVIIIW